MSINRKALLAAASTLAIIAAAPALAAEQNKPASTNAQAQSSMMVKADDLVGKDIKNAAGEDIGEIESVIIDGNGQVAAIIVGVGGFLGIGERDVAIDWKSLQANKSGDDLRVSMTKAQLETLPPYEYEKTESRGRSFVDNRYLERRDGTTAQSRDGMNARSNDGMNAKSSTAANWIPATNMRYSKLIGADVVDGAGKTIGEVDDIVVTGGRPQLILSVGEFLGIGGHQVALDIDKAKIHRERDDADDLRVSLSMSKEQVKAMPKYDLDDWGKRNK